MAITDMKGTVTKNQPTMTGMMNEAPSNNGNFFYNGVFELALSIMPSQLRLRTRLHKEYRTCFRCQ